MEGGREGRSNERVLHVTPVHSASLMTYLRLATTRTAWAARMCGSGVSGTQPQASAWTA